ncbi:fatty acid desaturase [Chlorogloeopsis sp. ULAP02]|uniref:fatty acid desaturase family protein n=1 Tax=Chlorogloeopsis sp. ULAP02 TaxID=3107926 RepID=UPI003135D25B
MKDFKIPKSTEQIIPQTKNLFKSVFFISLLVSSFTLAQMGASAIDTFFLTHPQPMHLVIKWAFIMIFAVFNSLLLTGVGVLAHEGIHRVLFKSKFWNDLWGGILSALVVMLPFYANRKFHLTHHRYTHRPGLDPEEKLHNYPFWYAFIMGGVIALYEHYKIVAAALFSGKWNRVFRGLKDIGFMSLAVTFYFYMLPMLGISPWYTVIPTFALAPPVYSFRALCDHYAFAPAVSPTVQKSFEHGADTEDEFQNLQGDGLQVDSWVILTNPFINWLWSHINYQQVHHRYPYLSHQYLPDIFEATKYEQPYAVATGFFRCLMSLRNMQYYSKPEQIKPFLFKEISGNSI